MTPYEHLVHLQEEIALLNSCNALLSWDQETNLPPKGVPFRSTQRAYLSEKAHALKTSDQVGPLLKKCQEGVSEDDSEEAANVRWWQREYDRASKIPGALVGEMEKASSIALDAWQVARENNDYDAFKPHLQTIIDFNCRMADLWGYDASPYDALLEEYEPGSRAAALTDLFQNLRESLVEIADAAIQKSLAEPPKSLQGNYPIAAQQAFNREVCEALGFDYDAGRIDTTTHPFCSRLAPYDTRLTTRYDVSDFTSSLFGVMHEAGHGLYEQGLPQDKQALPSGTAVSLGIHESQSRLWENHVGRGRAFWDYWLPRAARHFPELSDWTPEQITRAVNHAERSFIRVEADEVTYDLHVMLRFDLERRLIERSLSVDDLPEAWNTRFQELVGLAVPDNTRGCLQDIHWSMGGFGYFPTYSLGNLNAAQLYQQALLDEPTILTEATVGEYQSLLGWLRKSVHVFGCRYLPETLMIRATGRPTSPEPYLDHLRNRYLG